MIIKLTHHNKNYSADLSKPIDISLPIQEGANNPNCYYARDVQFNTIKSDDFIGSVSEGGSVNYTEVVITPHGNGTHTETYGHLSSDKKATIGKLFNEFHLIANLISLEPEYNGFGDQVITYDSFISKFNTGAEAVIIRTLPNNHNKRLKKYSGTNPAYLDPKIAEHLNKINVKHLLVDIPSLDKEVDGGELLAHRAFWGLPDEIRKDCTITELIYVDNHIQDGFYLLNLQAINMDLDAVPSRPIIFKLNLA